MSPSGTQKFVLLSMARSGTSLVTSTLREHPEIYCHGEIFHPKVEMHIRPEFLAQSDVTLRERDPVRFVDEILGFNAGRRCVGFKMWHVQNPAICERLLADASVGKIILERTNRLAAFSSAVLAKQSGVWNVGPRPNAEKLERARSEKADFNQDAFKEFMLRHDRIFAMYRERAAGAVLGLKFDDLVNGDGFDRIQAFLGVERHDLKKQKSRLHTTDILDRFNAGHRDEIRKLLEAIGHMDWLSEA